MPEKNLYEYSVIRYTPRVERGEFVNVGLIMMCKRRRWLRVQTHIATERLTALGGEADPGVLARQLESFGVIATADSGRFGEMAVEERFRWLTAVRSACISTSRPHPGLCSDLDKTFDELLAELVM